MHWTVPLGESQNVTHSIGLVVEVQDLRFTSVSREPTSAQIWRLAGYCRETSIVTDDKSKQVN